MLFLSYSTTTCPFAVNLTVICSSGNLSKVLVMQKKPILYNNCNLCIIPKFKSRFFVDYKTFILIFKVDIRIL
jgi:hypothetical protein